MPLPPTISDPAIGVVVELLQHVTKAHTAQDAFDAFMRHYWHFGPVEHFVGVLPDSSGEGRYRIALEVNTAAAAAGGPVAPRNLDVAAMERLPVHEGGVIGRLIRARGPAWLTQLDLRGDPAVGHLSGMTTCLALPVFAGAAISEWVVGFSSKVGKIEVRDALQALMTANLMGMINAHLTLVEDYRTLNRRLTRQLEEVAQIQQSLLPERLPDIPGLKIATSYLTSDQAGGDYYDFFRFHDGRWGILIADVSGHGAAAATVMAMLHGILHCYTGEDCLPDRILRHANAKLVEAGINGNFVTAFLAMYDPRDATLSYASSGHNPPRLKDGRTGEVRAIEEPASLPLGIFEPYEIASGHLRLRPNDTLLMYTDGITEEFNAEREMFGVSRLDFALDGCTGDPECVVGSVHGALFEHTKNRTRADDQTIVAFRYIGPEGGLGADELSRRVMADAAAALAGVEGSGS